VNVVPLFTSAFYKRNFILDTPDISNTNIVYRGILETKKYGNIDIDFLFDDDFFINFPHALIGINSQNKFKPYHFPHLDDTYCLCYHDGSYVFNRYDSEAMVSFCIENVIKIINETIEDDMNEILKEFPSYWRSTCINFYSYLAPIDNIAYIKENKIVSPSNLSLINNEKLDETPIFKLHNTPSIANIEWPLENYASFKEWISKTAPETEHEIQKHINYMISIKFFKIMIILFLEDLDTYIGFTIEFKNASYNLKIKKKFHPEIVKIIFNGNHILHRFNITNYNAKKIINSNISIDFFTFVNMKILLIGAGTIGSNLSNILVKNGTSIGEDAKFSIVDNDKYEPYNYSRHYLGINYAGFNKANALKFDLEYAFPFAKINAIDDKIQNIDIGNYDIIIDTTGEEALTLWLSEKVHISNPNFVFISTWINGNGSSAECLIIPNNHNACHECFRHSKYYSSKNITELNLRDSCNSVFVPFPISASMYTALLVINVLNKWFSGKITETTFFKQNLSPISEVSEKIILKNKECPLCGIN